MRLRDVFVLLPLLVIYTRPISTANPIFRVTFYDLVIVFLVAAVVQQRHKFRVRVRARDWTLIVIAFALVVGIAFAKEPDFLTTLPAVGGLVLGVSALFVILEFPSPFLAGRMVDAWLVGLAITIAAAFPQIGAAGRATGLFRFPNELGTYGVATIALLVAAHHFKAASFRKLLVGMAGATFVLIASGGRASIGSALLLVAFYAGLYVFASGHNFAKAVAVVVPIIMVGILLGVAGTTNFNITETIADSAGASSQRIVNTWEAPDLGSFFTENWQDAWDLFRSSPAIGRPISEATVDSRVLAGRYTVHNTILSLLVNYGWIGVALLSTPLLMLRRHGLLPPLGIGIVLGIGFLPVMMYHDLTESRTVWLVLALILRAAWEREQELALVDDREREMIGQAAPTPWSASRAPAVPPSRLQRGLVARRSVLRARRRPR